MADKHALLRPSAAERWMRCTPSARLEEKMPDTQTDATRAGTLAHELAALYLRKEFEDWGVDDGMFKALASQSEYNVDMQDAVMAYVDYVHKIADAIDPAQRRIWIEAELPITEYVPESYGRADVIIWNREDRQLDVIDFKSGDGIRIDAAWNPQLRLYALGALNLADDSEAGQAATTGEGQPVDLLKPALITLHVVQPKLDNYSSQQLPINQLRAWGHAIKPTAQMAWTGEGELVQGYWCDLCKAKPLCRVHSPASAIADLETRARSPHLMSAEEIGPLAKRARMVLAWYDSASTWIRSELINKRPVPGWTLKPGARKRYWVNLTGMIKRAVELGYQRADLIVEEPLSVAAMERLLGKSKFQTQLGKFVKSAPAGVNLVPVSDEAAEDFKSMTNAQEDET
jgi:hypothetical protein